MNIISQKQTVAWEVVWRPLGCLYLSTIQERINRDNRWRTGVVGIFPSADADTKLVTIFLMEYPEDWSACKADLSERCVQASLKPVGQTSHFTGLLFENST